MIRFLLFAALLACSATGCFVIDEIDAGMKLMEDHTPPEAEKEESETSKAEPAKADKDFWQNSRTIAPGSGGGADVVSCNLRGQIQFMERSDCINRGGKPR